MQDKPFDILTLNETRLDSTVLDCEIGIPGYNLTRHDRNRNGGGGGGGGGRNYIRNNIPYIKRDDLLQDALELLCIEIRKPKSKPLLFTTCYRPPSSKIELFESFENFLEQIDDENKDIVITGDLNCNLIEQGRSQATLKLQDIMETIMTFKAFNWQIARLSSGSL